MIVRAEERGVSQAERAATTLRQMILANEMPPGSNHLESELAVLLGMSRTPIREAAIMLANQGLVEIRPRHGIRVLPLTAEDMEEIYQILTELEPLAAQLVAGRKGVALDGLEDCIAEMEVALGHEDRIEWAAADARFHTHLVELANNRRLAAIVSTYSDQVHRARMMTLQMRPLPIRSNEDHRRLVDAILRGDGESAREIHRAHRLRAKELMLGLLVKHGMVRF